MKLIDNRTTPIAADSKRKNISIVVAENSNLDLYADRNVLYLIFQHLIETAIKFTKSSGQIIIVMTP